MASIFESRETIEHAIDAGVNAEGNPLNERQLEHLRTVAAMPGYDQMTLAERRNAYDQLSRGFQPSTTAAGMGTDAMPVIGWIMAILGAFVALGSQAIQVTVSSTTPGTFIGDTYLPGSTASVINIGLLQNQMMVFQAGLALAIGGIILLAASAVRSAVREIATADSSD